MARPVKPGLDYFPLDTSFFQRDDRIQLTLARFGPDAVAVYLYLLCRCYGDQGYYLRLDEALWQVLCDKLRLSRQRAEEILAWLGQLQLVDPGLLTRGVVSSHGIQRRYQEVMKARCPRRQSRLRVNPDWWLLSAEETSAFIAFPGEELALPISQEETRIPPPKGNETKSDESKAEQREAATAASTAPSPAPTGELLGKFRNVRLSPDELAALQAQTPDWAELIEDLSSYLASSGKSYRSHFATLLRWQRDARPQAAAPRRGLGIQPPAGDLKQPVGGTPGDFERQAVARMQRRLRTEAGQAAGQEAAT